MEIWYKQGETLLNQIHGYSTPEGELAMWWLAQCSVVFRHHGLTIAVDPFLNDLKNRAGESLRLVPAPFDPADFKVDYVLCTHGHVDHMALPTLQALYSTTPALKVILPSGCVKDAEKVLPPELLIPIEAGNVQQHSDFTVTAFSAAHPVHVFDANDSAMALGYRLQFGDISVTHLGDTYLTDTLYNALSELGPTDLLFTPINGGDYFRTAGGIICNMEPEEAAKLAIAIHADMSIPMHYDCFMGNTSDPLRFAAALRSLAPNARYYIPAHGECFVYHKEA